MPLIEYLTTYIGDREAQLQARGIKANKDGSTNLMPEYFEHCRSKKAFLTKIMTHVVLCFIFGVIVFYISQITLSGIVNAEGSTMDALNVFLNCMFVFTIAWHALLIMETWNWTGCTLFWFLFSAGMTPLTIWLEDSTPGSDYSHAQWTIVLRSPLYWLTMLLCAFIIAAPRYVQIVYQYVIGNPELTMIKD
jgi:magnesium-transporting ATPase (P-type)